MRDMRSLVDALLYILGNRRDRHLGYDVASIITSLCPEDHARVCRISFVKIREYSCNRSQHLGPSRQCTSLFSWTPPPSITSQAGDRHFVASEWNRYDGTERCQSC